MAALCPRLPTYSNLPRLHEPVWALDRLGPGLLEDSPCIDEAVPALLEEIEEREATTLCTQIIQRLCRRIHYVVMRTCRESCEFIDEGV